MMQQQDPFEAAGFIPVQQGGGLKAVPLPSKPDAPRDPLAIRKDELTIAKMERDLAKPDTPAKASGGLTANVRKDAIQAYTDAAGLESIADNLQRQFEAGPGATKGVAGLADFLPNETNKTFDDTASQARGFVKRALGFTGGEGNTIGEIQLNYGPYLPEASDWDGRIVNKIVALRGLAEQSRKRAISVLGGVPDANGNITPQAEKPAEINLSEDEGAPPVPTLTASTDGTRSVIDEKKRALGGKIVALVSKGADRNTIMGFAVRNDPSLRDDPKFKAWVDQALEYRKAKPGAKFGVDPSFYTTQVPMTPDEISANEKGQSGFGAAMIGGADAITAGNLGSIAGMVGGDKSAVDRSVQLSERDNPTASTLGSIGGSTLAALTGEAALGRLGMQPGVLRALLSDGGYGAIAGGSNADPGDGMSGALKGALFGMGGSIVGSQGANVLGKMARGVSDPTVGYVAREIPDKLTLGQMVGQSGRAGAVVKSIEDKATSIPIVGDMVQARRLEGLQAMNAKAFDHALKPIGENVAGQYGYEAIEAAQQKVSQAFSKALAGKVAQIDRGFITSAASARRSIDGLPDTVRGDVGNLVDDLINESFERNGQSVSISGDNMQMLMQGLTKLKASYKNTPYGHRVSKAVDQTMSAVEGLFARQTPDVMPAYRNAKDAYRRVSVLGDAVTRANGTGGVFTASQLGKAGEANAKKFSGKGAAANGSAPFHDFSQNMQAVLPSKVPDSGTAGRVAQLMVPGAIAGSGAGVGYAAGSPETGASAGLTLAGLLALAYSRHGQAAARALVRPSGPTGQAIGRGIERSRRAVAAATGSQAALSQARP